MPRWAAALEFVIPTEAEGSAVSLLGTVNLPVSELPSGFRFPINANCRSLRFGRDDKLEGGGSPWHGQKWMDRAACIASMADPLYVSLPPKVAIAEGV
jgi:hypothetical protein